jgi:hypothetical protein
LPRTDEKTDRTARELSYGSAVRAVGTLVMLAAAAPAGCVRDPASDLCPDVAAGELVVTEVRGPQSPEDADGSWIELYNASGRSIDLAGLKVRFRRKDGSTEIPILVRRSVPAAADSYTVLGLFADAAPPEHVDYGFSADYRQGWLSSAAIDVESCGVRIDLAQYDSLPDQGTFSLGGAPDADRNDAPASWCTDATKVGSVYPGTPRGPNLACP